MPDTRPVIHHSVKKWLFLFFVRFVLGAYLLPQNWW